MTDEFTFRRMQASDKDDVLRICSKIWEGNDFLPHHFDEWVRDEKGLFAAVLHDGKLTGMGKLTYLTDTDVLLEGLRKDQDIEIKGVAFAVTNHFIEFLKQRKGLTSFRFATYFQNHASIKAGEKLGFKVKWKFSLKHIPMWEENLRPVIPSFSPVQIIRDEKKILEYVHRSPYLEGACNLFIVGWLPYPYSDEVFIEKAIKPGLCRAIIYNDEIKALAAINFRQGMGMSMSFFDAENFSYAKSLANYLAVEGFLHGGWGVSIIMPQYDKLWGYIKDLGFVSWESENDVFIYEYPLTW